jgi:hypothetical protein
MSIRLLPFSAFLAISLLVISTAESKDSAVLNREKPTLHVDFDACVSYFGGYNEDYSEFTADADLNADCSFMELVGGSVYRRNPQNNTHSCTPGVDSIAMCVSGIDSCGFVENADAALRFDVLVIPGPDGVGSLDEIQFFSQAPENFVFIDGGTGENNYPTRMAVRVMANGVEVFREVDIETARSWTLRSFDFTSVAGFTVDVPTLFNFEILPYCLVGVDSDVMAWDIDELTITGGCNDVNGGLITVDGSTSICYPESDTTVRTFEVDMTIGSNFEWFVADENGEIVLIPQSNVIDFDFLPNGIYSVYYLAFDPADFAGLVRGGNIENFLGCFDLSNEIQIFNNKIAPGELGSQSSTSLFICNDNAGLNTVELELASAVSTMTTYLLLDSDSLILESSMSNIIDLSSYPAGSYFIVASSHNGDFFNAMPGIHVDALSGCFVLSNYISIEKELIDAGMISFDGDSTFVACQTSSFVINPLLQDTFGGISQWVMYTPSGMIVSIQDDLPIDLGMMLIPSLRLINLSYLGTISGLAPGENLADLEGCFDTSNVLSIDIPLVEGGTINTNGLDSISICVNDPDDAMVEVELEGIAGTAFSLVVTDSNGDILSIPNTNIIDFSGSPTGTCFIWNISFVNMLSGFAIGQNVADIVGCYDFSNPITVERIQLQPAEIATESGFNLLEICSGDGDDDTFVFEAEGFEGPFASFVVTDDSGNVLEVPASDTINFEGAPAGVCLVYHLVSTSDSLLNGVDLNINSLDACYELSNPVTVIRSEVNGGSIMTIDSTTELVLCLSDSLSDMIDVIIEGNLGEFSEWIITDEAGVILELSQSPPFDFSSAPGGTCLIYNVSYNGAIASLEIDSSINALSGCFSLSNPITVIRDFVDGGIVSEASGQDTINIIVGDGLPDSLSFSVIDAIGDSMQWLVTDAMGNILEILDDAPVDFENAPEGICHIYHLSFTGLLDGLLQGENIEDFAGCFHLSNFIVVNRQSVNGGMIMTVDSLTEIDLCIVEMMSDSVDVLLEGKEGDTFQWVITDTSGMILELPQAPPFDFSSAPTGICQIWHLASLGVVDGLMVGNNVADLTGLFNFSNPINVDRQQVDGGVISHISGMDSLMITVGDGLPDSIDLDLTASVGDFNQWIITDDMGQILALPDTLPFDFENGTVGTCLIWNIAYNELPEGLEVDSSALALEGCFDLSNPITVIREGVSGGMIMTVDSLLEIDLCIVEMMSDSVEVLLEGNDGDSFQWVITDISGMILELPQAPPFDFSMAPTGICQIWHLAYTGTITGLMEGNNVADLMGMFSFSNPINVNRQQVDGGILSHSSGMDSIIIIINDGLPDSIDLSLGASVGDFNQWIITDDMGQILALPDTLPFDFEGSEAGTCLVWNIAYNELPEGLEVDSSALSLEGCFDLSNAFTVIRQEISGGMIMTTDSLTDVSVCLNDTLPELVDVILADTLAMNYSWIITDTNGVILELPMAPPFDFSMAPAGICQIWHLGYQDNLMGLSVGGNVADLTGTFDFSNPINVQRDSLAGGMLSLDNGMVTDTIEVGEGITDIINVVLQNALADNQIYLVTDTLGNIIDTSALSQFDFENSGSGICLIWSLSYSDGLSGLEQGNNVSVLDGCFDLSNAVAIVKQGISGGNLSLPDGSTEIVLCLSDTTGNVFDVVLTDTVGVIHSWIVTDSLGVILELPAAAPFDLSSLATDFCQLWNLSHDMGLTGLMVGNNVADLDGNFAFSNPIDVFKDEVSASSITTVDSLFTVMVTVGDGIPDTIQLVSSGGNGDSSVWLIVDGLGNIEEISDAPLFELDNFDAGICEIYEINFSASTTGLTEGSNISLLDGCFALSNIVQVIKMSAPIDAGTIMTPEGLTMLDLCIVDAMAETIDVVLEGAQGPNFQWVITDTTGLILGLPTAPPFDLSLAGAGLCQIWHIAFAPGLNGLAIGENVNDLDGFFDFSNPISVNRQEVSGGSMETEDGMTEITIPVGEGVVDSIDLLLIDNEGEFQAWLVTNTDGMILQANVSPPLDLESLGGGVCMIWSISYNGTLTGLMAGNEVSDLEGCFALSNSIMVTKEGPNGGFLKDDEGSIMVNLCLTDAFQDFLDLELTDTIGTQYQLLLVDSDNDIIGLPASEPIDFTGLPFTECSVYNLAYDNLSNPLMIGQSIDSLEGIFHLSNPVDVSKVEVNGGLLSYADGSMLDTIDVGNGIPDTIDLDLSVNISSLNQWIITDTFGVIQLLPITEPFELDSLSGGVCLIWNLAYEPGIVGLELGNNVDQLDGCYSFSNSVTLVKEGLNGGLLSFDDMTMETETCFGDGLADFVGFDVQGAQGTNQDYLITSISGQLLVIDAPNPFNFESIPVNIDSFLIYNISYDTLPGNYTQGSFLSGLTGNFALSNEIVLIRNIQNAGEIADEGGETSSEIIVADGVLDTLTLVAEDALADSLVWVMTNENDTILSIQDSGVFVFDSLASGICNIYQIGFDPDLTTDIMEGISVDSLSGCYSISNAYVLTKKALNPGLLSTSDGSTSIEICVGDDSSDIFDMNVEGAIGSNFVFIVVNPSGFIVQNTASPQVDLTNIQPGMCEIYHLAHDGSLGGLANGVDTMDLTGCFLLSNPVSVNKLGVFGGNLMFNDITMEQDVCINDAIDDFLTWETTSVTGDYVYAITDTLNVIDTLIPVSTFNFSDSELGTCRIWGISYVGNLIAMQGDTVGVSQLVEDCFDVSNDFLTVNKLDCSQPQPIAYELYPNPVVDRLTLRVDQLSNPDAECLIFDSFGKLVHRQQVSKGMTYFEARGLNAGIYYMRIKSGPFTKTQRFVIAR